MNRALSWLEVRLVRHRFTVTASELGRGFVHHDAVLDREFERPFLGVEEGCGEDTGAGLDFHSGFVDVVGVDPKVSGCGYSQP